MKKGSDGENIVDKFVAQLGEEKQERFEDDDDGSDVEGYAFSCAPLKVEGKIFDGLDKIGVYFGYADAKKDSASITAIKAFLLVLNKIIGQEWDMERLKLMQSITLDEKRGVSRYLALEDTEHFLGRKVLRNMFFGGQQDEGQSRDLLKRVDGSSPVFDILFLMEGFLIDLIEQDKANRMAYPEKSLDAYVKEFYTGKVYAQLGAFYQSLLAYRQKQDQAEISNRLRLYKALIWIRSALKASFPKADIASSDATIHSYNKTLKDLVQPFVGLVSAETEMDLVRLGILFDPSNDLVAAEKTRLQNQKDHIKREHEVDDAPMELRQTKDDKNVQQLFVGAEIGRMKKNEQVVSRAINIIYLHVIKMWLTAIKDSIQNREAGMQLLAGINLLLVYLSSAKKRIRDIEDTFQVTESLRLSRVNLHKMFGEKISQVSTGDAFLKAFFGDRGDMKKASSIDGPIRVINYELKLRLSESETFVCPLYIKADVIKEEDEAPKQGRKKREYIAVGELNLEKVDKESKVYKGLMSIMKSKMNAEAQAQQKNILLHKLAKNILKFIRWIADLCLEVQTEMVKEIPFPKTYIKLESDRLYHLCQMLDGLKVFVADLCNDFHAQLIQDGVDLKINDEEKEVKEKGTKESPIKVEAESVDAVFTTARTKIPDIKSSNAFLQYQINYLNVMKRFLEASVQRAESPKEKRDLTTQIQEVEKQLGDANIELKAAASMAAYSQK